MAKDNKEWYCQLLTIKDTVRDAPGERGGPVLTQEDIDAERKEGMSDDMIDQEYYCSFQGSLAGAYYLREINDADRQGRIKTIPWNPTMPVYTWWDLGYDDSTTIWFMQANGSQYAFIDYEEQSQKGLPFYAKLLQEKPYTYGEHVFPHDIDVHDYGSGRTRRQMAEDLGIHPITIAPKWRVHEGINAARSILPRCFFDKDKCARGLDSLRNYKKDWDEVRKVYKDQPNHDWASHGADAFRTGAVGFDGGSSLDGDYSGELKQICNMQHGI
jgi:phage terminase large subunit